MYLFLTTSKTFYFAREHFRTVIKRTGIYPDGQATNALHYFVNKQDVGKINVPGHSNNSSNSISGDGGGGKH